MNLFFSYSHKDEAARNELEVHLSMLRREGLIDAWHDRRIGAGQDLQSIISEKLESADIILLLVSPYFLASDYCYEIEMTRALERHASGEARVIPIILEPCDWLKSPIGKLRATPLDGKPVSKHTNLNDAYLVVTQDVRQAVENILNSRGKKKVTIGHQKSITILERSSQHRSSNLRIKKKFTEKEREDFLDESFEYMARFFENSLEELKNRNSSVETKYRRIDATQFEGAVFVHGDCRTRCQIRLGGQSGFGPGIYYSSNRSYHDSSFNHSFSVEDDGYTLGLTATMNFYGEEAKHVTTHGAAEHLWEKFLAPMQ